jgi:formylglycine-generating enzyme required for sulfatase activity
MTKTFMYSETIRIPAAKYIYRVVHRIMEGDCEYDHGPREVEVRDLEIGKYPVTNTMYKVFLDETGYAPKDAHNFLKHWENGMAKKGHEHFPVVWVSQRDAKAYALWSGSRLPYDYEWQFVSAGRDKLVYPWGNHLIKENFNHQGKGLTPVNQYPQGASPFGVMDMCGNAHEWVEEVIDDGKHQFTFLRGGCYFQAPHFWHTDGGARPNFHHLKFQLLSEGHNRCGTTTFRCVKEV